MTLGPDAWVKANSVPKSRYNAVVLPGPPHDFGIGSYMRPDLAPVDRDVAVALESPRQRGGRFMSSRKRISSSAEASDSLRRQAA